MRKNYLYFLLSLIMFWVEGIYSQIITAKTLKRYFDPVVIEGKSLKQFLGKKISNLRVYSYQNGEFKPIPYQIDKKDNSGDYIFSTYSQDKVLEENDELVFMAKDTGDRITFSLFPQGFDFFSEISIYDLKNREEGWVYIFYFQNNPPDESPLDYVDFFPSEEKVVSWMYEVGFSKDIPMIMIHLSTTERGGGDNKNLIDRLKIRFWGRTLFGITIKIDEDDFTGETLGWIDGKVRVIRRTKNRAVFFKTIPSPPAISDSIFYFSHFELPFVINLGFNPRDIFVRASLRVSSECNSTDRKFYNSNNLSGVDIDGVMTDEEKKLDTSPYRWSVIAKNTESDKSAWLNQVVFSTLNSVKPSLYYTDDINIPDFPENIPGQIGNVGYVLQEFQHIGKGTHKFTSFLYSLPEFKPGDEKTILDISDNPVKVLIN